MQKRTILSLVGFMCQILAGLSAQQGTPQKLSTEVAELKMQGAAFTPINLFDPAAQKSAAAAGFNKTLADGIVMQLDFDGLAQGMAQQAQTLSLELPWKDGGKLQLELVRHEVTTPDFSVVTDYSNGEEVAYQGGLHYRGTLKGDPNSVVALSLFDDEVMGLIATPKDGNIILGQLGGEQRYGEYVLYAEKDLVAKPQIDCHTEELPELPPSFQENAKVMIAKCVRIYFECDNTLCVNKGGVTPTTNYVTALFNQVATLYQNEQIQMLISQVYVWANADPFTGPSSENYLTQFRSYRTSFNGDLAHLLYYSANGSLGGIAYVNSLCNNSYRYGFSNLIGTFANVPTYSWDVMVVTHELGHNIGSPHTHKCAWNGNNTALDNCYTTEGGCPPGPAPVNGGTIMSYCHTQQYGINFSNGFGTQPGNLIRSKVTNAPCLTTCGGGQTCGTPGSLAANSVTASSATLQWAAVAGASSYTLQYRVSSSQTWTTVNNVVGISRNVTGLSAGTPYYFQVRAVCNGVNGSYANPLRFYTLNASCTETTEPNETQAAAKVLSLNVSKTAKISTASDQDWFKITTTGAAPNIRVFLFNLPANYHVRLYNAAGTQVAYSLNNGTTPEYMVYNNASPGVYSIKVYGYNGAFNANACYTVRPETSGNAFGNLPGDDQEDLGQMDVEEPEMLVNKDGIMAFPNPADDVLNVRLDFDSEQSVELGIYDLTGRPVLQELLNGSYGQTQSLNISSLIPGVYLVRVTDGERTFTQKVVVQ